MRDHRNPNLVEASIVTRQSVDSSGNTEEPRAVFKRLKQARAEDLQRKAASGLVVKRKLCLRCKTWCEGSAKKCRDQYCGHTFGESGG